MRTVDVATLTQNIKEMCIEANHFLSEDMKKAFTKAELAELEAAKKMPITFDADCPETTPERAVKFRRVNPPRNRMDAHGA